MRLECILSAHLSCLYAGVALSLNKEPYLDPPDYCDADAPMTVHDQHRGAVCWICGFALYCRLHQGPPQLSITDLNAIEASSVGGPSLGRPFNKFVAANLEGVATVYVRRPVGHRRNTDSPKRSGGLEQVGAVRLNGARRPCMHVVARAYMRWHAAQMLGAPATRPIAWKHTCATMHACMCLRACANVCVYVCVSVSAGRP